MKFSVILFAFFILASGNSCGDTSSPTTHSEWVADFYKENTEELSNTQEDITSSILSTNPTSESVWMMLDNVTSGSRGRKHDVNIPRTSETLMKLLIKLAKEEPLYRVGLALQVYGTYTISALGVLTNFVALVVFTQKSARKSSPNIYLAFLSVADALFLFSAMVEQLLLKSAIFGAMSKLKCGVILVILKLTGLMSHWLVAAMSVERMIVVCFPLRSPVLCSTKRTIITCITITISSIIVASPLYWISDIDPYTNECLLYPLETGIQKMYYFIAGIGLGVLFPVTLCLIMTGTIIKSLHFSDSGSPLTIDSVSTNQKSFSAYVTRILLLISMCFLASSVLTIALMGFSNAFIEKLASPRNFALYFLLDCIAKFARNFNSSSNFWFFCVSGTKFRKDVLDLFRCVH